MLNKKLYSIWALMMFVLVPETALGMHIMEGFLPVKWAIFWTLISLPVVIAGVISITKKMKENPELKLLLGVAGAFAFVLSALKIPSVTGSSSHPTGVGLGAILFGPAAMSVLGTIVLLFQAILLAHGGITTLGANVFSMAIVGTFVAYGTFKFSKKVGLSTSIAVFLAAALGNLMTYVTTSLQLAFAFPAEAGGVIASAVKFLTIFAVTQVPLAISEGLLTVVIFNFLSKYSTQELFTLNILKKGEVLGDDNHA